MSKTKLGRKPQAELDSTYFLKLVMYLIIGTIWLRLGTTAGTFELPLPLGLLIGMAFARHEHFQIDRKIEYAVLLVAMVIGFWAQVGLSIVW